jgi:hypothetical protein
VGNRAIVVAGIVAGFFVVSFAANYSPELVNGVLLLILVGTILGNSDRWLPLLAQFSNAGSASIARPVVAGAGGAHRKP